MAPVCVVIESNLPPTLCVRQKRKRWGTRRARYARHGSCGWKRTRRRGKRAVRRSGGWRVARKEKQKRKKDNAETLRTQRFAENCPSERECQPPCLDAAKASRKKVELPVVRSRQPWTLDLDNDKSFEIISFP